MLVLASESNESCRFLSGTLSGAFRLIPFMANVYLMIGKD
jgi:hypothetical protein